MKAKEALKILKHSTEFLKLLNEGNTENSIKTITHSNPLFVFWVSNDGEILDAKKSHHENPPKNDRSILADKQYKGYLRGRAAFIGNTIYIVVYGLTDLTKNKRMFYQLRRFYPNLLQHLTEKFPEFKKEIEKAIFIDELGNELL